MGRDEEASVKQGIYKVVRAPQLWHCDDCGGRIEAGEECVKSGSKKYCSDCAKKWKGQ